MKTKILALLLILSIFFCIVGCREKKIRVDMLVLNNTTVQLKEGETFNLLCSISPSNASNKKIVWSSSKNSIAKVDENGVVHAVNAGTCVITATCDGKTVNANVTVKKQPPNFYDLYTYACERGAIYFGMEDALDFKTMQLVTDIYYITLGNDYSYITIDSNPLNVKNFLENDIHKAIKDLHKKMGLPESLYSKMGDTTALMGRQTEIFTSIGVSVSWTYHPNKGLEIQYTLLENY